MIEARRPHGRFTNADVALLRSFASQASIALENARLYHHLDGLFRSYMSPAVVTALLADPEQAGLGGAIVEVTVLMADLRGFTAFAEVTSPDQVVAMLNTYYGAVVPVILDAGGTVVQFVGDAVVALEPTRTLALRRSVLFGLREQHPSIDRFLITTMAGYVRRLSAMVLDAMYLPVEQRVRRQLVELAGIYGGDAQGAEIHLTQDDIANFAGTTRATANRVLRALESRGVLTLARGRIITPDRDRLESSTR